MELFERMAPWVTFERTTFSCSGFAYSYFVLCIIKFHFLFLSVLNGSQRFWALILWVLSLLCRSGWVSMVGLLCVCGFRCCSLWGNCVYYLRLPD